MRVTLRPAREADSAQLLAWRNDPDVRAASFAQREVSEPEHREWLRSKLADTACRLLIVEEGGEPVGQVRLDRLPPDEAEVSIGLAATARGRGIGRVALELAVGEAAAAFDVGAVSARVKEDNEPSLRAFAAAGFGEVRRAGGVVTLRRAAPQASSVGSSRRST